MRTSTQKNGERIINAGHRPPHCRQFEIGASAHDAMRKAKQVGSFSGPMRTKLVALLDHIGLPKWLGFPSCGHLFDSHTDLLQTASVLQFPVFVDGQNHNGILDSLTPALLISLVLLYFAPLG